MIDNQFLSHISMLVHAECYIVMADPFIHSVSPSHSVIVSK